MRDVSTNIGERIDNLSGTELEQFIADLLMPFGALGWKVFLTRKGSDFGADIIFDNPHKVRHAIQIKHREDVEKTEALDAVQEVVAAKAMYQATFAIAATSAENFSNHAKQLAGANGVTLWVRKDLQRLYEASLNRDESTLIALGLSREPISSSKPEATPSVVTFTIPLDDPSPAPKPTSKPLFWAVGAAMVIFSGLGFVLGSQLPKPNTTLQSLQTLVEGHDVGWIKAQATNDPSYLEPYRTGLAFSGASSAIKQRKQLNCTINIQQKMTPEISSMSIVGNTASLVVEKNWDQQLNCDRALTAEEQKQQDIGSGSFAVVYKAEWRITEAAVARGFQK